jgi:TPR repeat protein
MIARLSFAHFVLWFGDTWYRRAWYLGPQLLAFAIAGWILMPSSAPMSPGSMPAPWANPIPPVVPAPLPAPLPGPVADPTVAAEALRDRAEVDPAAFEDLKSQATAGNSYMQFLLGTLFDPNFKMSKLVAPNIQTAMNYYRLAADQGIPLAENNYGYYLATGNSGIARDPATGFPYVLRAANANVPLAELNVGILYRDGIGVTPDLATALTWFQKSANGGNHFSEVVIGDAYWNGTAPYPKDPAQAVSWYIRGATDPNEPGAARMLGIAYRDGAGVGTDRPTSLKWFRQAAEKNDPYSAAEIAFAYLNGTPPYPLNPAEAFNWLRIAATAPTEAVAQRFLGIAYRDGRGTRPDPAQARYWLGQAFQHGDTDAGKLLGTVR